MDFFVPETKIKKLASMISNALNQSFTTAKFIARIAGNIISMGIAIGPLTRLFTRQMYKFIESRLTWHSIKEIDKLTKEELIFWHKNLQNANGFRIKTNKLTSKIVYSDASGFAYGGFILQRLSNVIAHGYFTEHEMLTSSTNRELLTVKYVMESLGYLLQHESVLWYSDNFNTARIIEVGSTKPHLQKIALEIFELCLKNDITLHSSWIPRELNVTADSKFYDSDNWSIDNETFEYIQQNFDRFTVDRFADNHNTKLPVFNSKYHCPGSASVNAFTTDWSLDFNWLCPPIKLVGKTISHMRFCKSQAVLFVPEWKSSFYWPFLLQTEKLFSHL